MADKKKKTSKAATPKPGLTFDEVMSVLIKPVLPKQKRKKRR